MKYKTAEEIRSATGLSQAKFANVNGLSLRTYIGRLDGSQPKWLLTDIIAIAKHNNGAIRVDSYGETYDIFIKKHEG